MTVPSSAPPSVRVSRLPASALPVRVWTAAPVMPSPITPVSLAVASARVGMPGVSVSTTRPVAAPAVAAVTTSDAAAPTESVMVAPPDSVSPVTVRFAAFCPAATVVVNARLVGVEAAASKAAMPPSLSVSPRLPAVPTVTAPLVARTNPIERPASSGPAAPGMAARDSTLGTATAIDAGAAAALPADTSTTPTPTLPKLSTAASCTVSVPPADTVSTSEASSVPTSARLPARTSVRPFDAAATLAAPARVADSWPAVSVTVRLSVLDVKAPVSDRVRPPIELAAPATTVALAGPPTVRVPAMPVTGTPMSARMPRSTAEIGRRTPVGRPRPVIRSWALGSAAELARCA